MLSEAYGVNAAGKWEERARAYPWRSAGKAMEMNFEIATQAVMPD